MWEPREAPGVAALVAQTNGAIGYVELSYAKSNKITFARVQNTAGNFISPGPNSIASAASDFPQVSATHFSIVNASGDRSYPICGYSSLSSYQGADRSPTMGWRSRRWRTGSPTLVRRWGSRCCMSHSQQASRRWL